MKKIVLLAGALALALSAAGCAPLSTVWDAATGATVPTTGVIVAVNTFDALEATATNYLSLPKCVNGGPVLCRDPGATAKIIPAVRAGRAARTNLESFLQANPGQLGPSGLYNALQASVTTLQGILTQYGVKS